MKKVFLMVIVAVIAMVAVITTGCNNNYNRVAYVECKSGLELARDFGCMTWDVHYYGYNSRDMAEGEREVMKRNGIVCTEVKADYYRGRGVYSFKTLNSRV